MTWVLFLFVLVRFGLLAWIFAFTFDVFFRGLFPLVSDYPSWYAEPILVYLAVIGGLIFYGFRICLAGRPLFGSDPLDRSRGSAASTG